MENERWANLEVWKLSDEIYEELREGYDLLGKMLWRFYETVKKVRK